ncbi:hypothetical protein CTAYLR_006418 [Chrysophaeum taylorii]|uniref:Glutathione transferase n=1 Tax=Chrysophaeum taylorii TaxID=2483200 RepID=A0AAD7UBW5_9STRA|nr:hypothetical protein CTAYLR_006418 [Chrysophaeum taylorii]
MFVGAVLLRVVLAPLAAVVGVVVYIAYKIAVAPRLTGKQPNKVPTRSSKPFELYYFHDSLCSQKVRLFLAEKGLSDQVASIHLDIGHYKHFQHLEPWYLAMDPNGTVPCLVHDAHPVLDSTHIIKYLDGIGVGPMLAAPTEWADVIDVDTRPQAVGACEGFQTAVVVLSGQILRLSVEFFGVSDTFFALLRHPQPIVCLIRIINRLTGVHLDPPNVEKALRETIPQNLARIDKALSAHDFIAGDTITTADIGVAPAFMRLESLGLLDHFLASAPNVQRWWVAMKARPSFAFAFVDPPAEYAVEHDKVKAGLLEFRRKIKAYGPFVVYGVKPPTPKHLL